MLRDSRLLPAGQIVEGDVCIIGAGAAGITLASELAHTGLTVHVLESGGLEYDQDTQDLYHGEVIGFGVAEPDVGRLRFFGGTTNHWGNTCRPLDRLDFEARDWMPESGWPITAEELEPYYRRAHAYCQLGRFAYRDEDWIATDRPRLDLAGDRITMNYFQFHDPATRFGEVYRAPLAASSNVTVWLHANCTEIVTSDDERNVAHVSSACLDGTRFVVQARLYVLATGAIENARLLLLSDRRSPTGLGNRKGLVGRYFADHPYLSDTARIVFSAPYAALPFFQHHQVGSARLQRFFGVSPATQRLEKIANCGILIRPERPPAVSGVSSLATLRRRIVSGEWPDDLLTHLGRILVDIDDVAATAYRKMTGTPPQVYTAHFWTECHPVAASRVTLSRSRDALDQRQIVLDWQVPASFGRTYTRMHEILAEELGRSGIGRLQILASAEEARSRIHDSHHHMGTTRMHADPTRGVVDAQCRVHGVANLFVAGSSVFPAYGHANSTLTIVALAVRLADHLRSLAT